MSKELVRTFTGAAPAKAGERIEAAATGYWWNSNSSALEAYDVANIAYYATLLTEGSPNVWTGDVPTDLPVGSYRLHGVRVADGTALTVADLEFPLGEIRHIYWNGAAIAEVESDTLSDRAYLRLLIQDQNEASYIFSNTEIDNFLSRMSDDVYMAASVALFAMAADRAKVNLLIRQGTFTRDATGVARELRRMAEEYRKMANEFPAVAVGYANDPLSSVLGVPA